MHTEYLAEGFQVFVIGFGGVFVNLIAIYGMMLLIGRVLKGFDSSEKTARGD